MGQVPGGAGRHLPPQVPGPGGREPVPVPVLAAGQRPVCPKKPDSTYLTIGKQSESEVERLLRGGKYRVVCVNDDPMDFDFDTERQQLVDIFQRTFPQTSAFERS